MKSFSRFFVLLVLIVALLIPLGAVQAQDGGDDSISVAEIAEAVQAVNEAEETPAWQDTMQDVLVAVAYGSAIVILFALAVVAVALLGVLIKWLFSQYVAIDAMLAPFGQTYVGKAIHEGARQAYQRVDQPTDPAIQLMTHYVGPALTLFNTVLPVSDQMLPEEIVSKAARTTVNGITELFNGLAIPAHIKPEDLVRQWGEQPKV